MTAPVCYKSRYKRGFSRAMKGTRLALVTGRTGETTPKQGRGEPAQPAQSAGDATTKHTNLATSRKPRPLSLGQPTPRERDELTPRTHPLRSTTNLNRDARWIGERIRRRYRGDAA